MMDYKYIKQLIERYWQGETSLEEERILRAFFSQDNVPDELAGYRSWFVYQQTEPQTDTLSSGFDDRILAAINEPAAVKTRVITMRQRFMPLLRAAAVVAIILTLGNAAQIPFSNKKTDTTNVNTYGTPEKDFPFAMSDSSTVDTMQQSRLPQVEQPAENGLK